MSNKKFRIEGSLSVGFDEMPKSTPGKADTRLLEQKYRYAIMILEQEKERRKTVESKASLFLTSNAIIGSLLAWSSRILFEKWSVQSFVVSLVLLVLVVLLACTILNTLKVLKKCNYEVLDENDAKNYMSEDEFYREMTVKAERVIKNNQIVINRKVDYMAAAQNCYRWFWIAMVCYLLIIFAFQLSAAGSFFPLFSSISGVNVLLFAIVFLVGLTLGVNLDEEQSQNS